jgi:urocanate hydratase
VNDVIKRIRELKGRSDAPGISIGYHGNVVTLWEALAAQEELLVDLGSDQTSLHNPFNGGYYPVQLSFEEAQEAMAKDPEAFKATVQQSLRRHAAAINILAARGMSFWDYGNSFLLESFRYSACEINRWLEHRHCICCCVLCGW